MRRCINRRCHDKVEQSQTVGQKERAAMASGYVLSLATIRRSILDKSITVYAARIFHMSQKVNIKTADGTCDTYLYPDPGNASAPAIIFYMDGLGIRPELQAMAQRLASNGYFVM